jgi:hypothetical protein
VKLDERATLLPPSFVLFLHAQKVLVFQRGGGLGQSLFFPIHKAALQIKD